ncbi:hypothetical protein AB0M54_19775 [Actinoplanes sp. NPDC051470]|uniref:hypothetical protein n=1 Tax=Actinoplanes sp. NPDC051470 TaxID=3157224 RepID=UPI00341C6B3E
MRTLLRAGVLALAAGTTLLGSAVAVQAAPPSVSDQIVMEPGAYGHTGRLRVTFHNPSNDVQWVSFRVTEPIRDSLRTGEDVNCLAVGREPDGRAVNACDLWDGIQPGATRIVDLRFASPSKPEAFAQITPDPAVLDLGGGTPIRVPTVFRSTTGSLADPVPYQQDTVADVSLTAGDVTLTRQADGTFEGRVPVTVRNNGDAQNWGAVTEVALPAGLDEWPGLESLESCVKAGTLPPPPGGETYQCDVTGGMLNEGESRTAQWVLRAPEGTPAGPLGKADALARLGGALEGQPGDANRDTFVITVAR